MDRNTVREFLSILGVSAIIGAAVAFPFYRGGSIPYALPTYLALSALAGLTIGFISRMTFQLVFGIINRHPAFAFLAVAGVIGLGTFGWSLLLDDTTTSVLIAVLAVSEGAGMTATALFWRYSRMLNRRLREKQDSVSESEDRT